MSSPARPVPFRRRLTGDVVAAAGGRAVSSFVATAGGPCSRCPVPPPSPLLRTARRWRAVAPEEPGESGRLTDGYDESFEVTRQRSRTSPSVLTASASRPPRLMGRHGSGTSRPGSRSERCGAERRCCPSRSARTTVSSLPRACDHTARLWDAETGELAQVLRCHYGRVADANFSPDGRWIVTAGPATVGLCGSRGCGSRFSPTGSAATSRC